MDCSTPGFPVLHYLSEFAQTHVHWVSDAIQPSHPLSPPSPPALSPSQHQGLFQWVSSLHQVVKVLELQHQSFQWIFRVYFFRVDWFVLLAVQGTLKNFLQHHIQKHQFFGAQPSSWSNSHNSYCKHIFDHDHGNTTRLPRLPVIWKTWVQSLGQEVPLEKEMVTHSSILTWKIPWMDGPGRL